MSTQRKAEFTEDVLSEADVHSYLQRHPDFFERHASLLSALRLPHATGAAVSLVERQVSVLRQKDLKLERKLKELLDVARANDALADKIHKTALDLLEARDPRQTLGSVEAALRTEFGADHAVLVVFGEPASFGNSSPSRFFRPLERNDPALQPFATFMGSSNPRCGQVRDAQRDFLFGEQTNEVGSAALVPLGDKCRVGFLAIGSVDADHFHPGMSFDFLKRLGELIAVALKRH
ncbi:MAG TPA: DUF484 family protein [Woeseiaceae bacterium]|jgi:hypothetical protein|nr:DUF484 family protein [Woeseiaceae bacterium]